MVFPMNEMLYNNFENRINFIYKILVQIILNKE